jgi:tRNA-modifying protein YgfZ
MLLVSKIEPSISEITDFSSGSLRGLGLERMGALTGMIEKNLLGTSLAIHKNTIVNLPWECIRVSGQDAEKFLQGQITCDVTQVTVTKSSLGAICNHQGRVLATFYICKTQDSFWLLLPRHMASYVILHLTKFAVFSRVSLEEYKDVTCLGIFGLDAAKLLQKNFREVPIAEYQTSCFDDNSVIFSCTGCVPCYVMVGPQQILQNWQKEFCDEFVIGDASAWELMSIQSGIPFIQSETIGIVTPHMLNLHVLDAVSFNKGCYVGQEIIARTHYLGKSKRLLLKAQINCEQQMPIPKPGDMLHYQQQEMGVIINACRSSDQNYSILAVVRENAQQNEIFWGTQIVQDWP